MSQLINQRLSEPQIYIFFLFACNQNIIEILRFPLKEVIFQAQPFQLKYESPRMW